MAISNDLLAAAELVIDIFDSELGDGRRRQLKESHEACILLARHVKAGMDDGPLDVDFILQLGFKPDAHWPGVWWRNIFCARIEGSTPHVVGEGELVVRVAMSQLPVIKSRGQLLKLVEALGMEVGT